MQMTAELCYCAICYTLIKVVHADNTNTYATDLYENLAFADCICAYGKVRGCWNERLRSTAHVTSKPISGSYVNFWFSN